MMFTTDDGRVSYCRFADIREHDGQWYLIAPQKDKASVAGMEDSPFEVPSGYEAVHINSEGYDLELRDIYDERVYSNSRAVVLYGDRIFPADPFTTPYGHDEKMMKSGRIIVTGHWFKSDNLFLLSTTKYRKSVIQSAFCA